MFERFTDTARHVVVQAQEDARRLGHGYIGCEHLLLAAAAAAEPASTVLRDQGVTPERIEAEILRTVGQGQPPARWAAAWTARRWLSSASTSTSSAPGSKRRSARTPSPGPSRLPASVGGQPGGKARWPG